MYEMAAKQIAHCKRIHYLVHVTVLSITYLSFSTV